MTSEKHTDVESRLREIMDQSANSDEVADALDAIRQFDALYENMRNYSIIIHPESTATYSNTSQIVAA